VGVLDDPHDVPEGVADGGHADAFANVLHGIVEGRAELQQPPKLLVGIGDPPVCLQDLAHRRPTTPRIRFSRPAIGLHSEPGASTRSTVKSS